MDSLNIGVSIKKKSSGISIEDSIKDFNLSSLSWGMSFEDSIDTLSSLSFMTTGNSSSHGSDLSLSHPVKDCGTSVQCESRSFPQRAVSSEGFGAPPQSAVGSHSGSSRQRDIQSPQRSFDTVGQALGAVPAKTECRSESYDLYMIGAVGNNFCTDAKPTDFQRYDFDKETWSTLNYDLPAIRRADFAVATLGGDIWVLGGTVMTVDDRELVVDNVSVYDTNSGTWSMQDNMECERAEFCTAFVGGRLYAIGGRYINYGTGAKTGIRKTVEMFVDGNWRKVASMNTGRYSFASCVVGEKIFVAGGVTTRSVTKTVEYYSARSDQWTYAADMPKIRESFGLVFVYGKLYAVGGDRDGSVVSKDIELMGEQWSHSIITLPTGLRSYGVFSLDGEIHVLGKTEMRKGRFYKFRPTDYWPMWEQMNSPLSPCDGGVRVALIKKR